MALLAESLVEEWLNRSGFFTIRGTKHGVDEIDLLGIRRDRDGSVTGWHVEVQASFRPIGYIGKLTKDLVELKGKKSASAIKRTPEEVELCARGWVRTKFSAETKARVRERLWPGVLWSYHLVHGVVREPRELSIFETEGVTCHPFHAVLSKLLERDGTFSGSAGGDLAEIVGYYQKHSDSHKDRPVALA